MTDKDLGLLTIYLRDNHVFGPEIIEVIARDAIANPLVKREKLFQQGNSLDYVYWFPQGIIRYYVTNEEGKESTNALRVGPTFICSTYSMASGQPCPFTAEVISGNIAYSFNISLWYELTHRYSEFAQFYIRLLEGLFAHKSRRELSFLNQTPESRYLDFLDDYQPYIGTIPQWVIASYLGITPEALSRIKRRLSDSS
tara:strand:- start:1912 stop:2505 length:594 start_codon:yes stop_codon:yes gene_type:complete